MRFVFVDISNVLGLRGSINFLKNPSLLYGRNLAGKTNVINLIRYCFVSGKSGKKYKEENRLSKDELLLNQSKDGKATFYLEHKGKLFKLEYQFRRSYNTVNQRVHLYETSDLPSLSGNTEDILKDIRWGEPIASNLTQLREKLVGLEIYSDMIDILISPSNVRNFTEAINKELVTIPDIIAKRISDLHNGAEKLLGNFQKLQGVLVQEKENYQGRLNELKNEFQNECLKSPEEIAGIFILGKISRNLEEESKNADQELSQLPSRETQLELLKQKWGSEFRDKFQKISDAKSVLQEEKEAIKQREDLSALTADLDTVKDWNAKFKSLPSKENIQALMDFKLPSEKEVDFQRFLNPQRIRTIFDLLKKAKRGLKKVSEIAKKYNVIPTLGEVRSLASSYKKLEKAVKSPQDKPKGDQAVILYSEEDKQSEVYLPIEALTVNPNYLKGIKPTPSVYKTKDLSKKELEKIAIQIKRKANDLEECRTKLGLAIDNNEQVKRSLPSLASEISYLQKDMTDKESSLNSRLSNWQTNYKVLLNTFGIEYTQPNLETVDGIREFVLSLHETLDEIEPRFSSELKQALASAGIEIPREFDIGKMTNVENLLTKRGAELLEKKERLEKVKNWINANLNEVRAVEDRLLTISFMETTIIVLQTILEKIQDYSNLEAMSEQIAQHIEENVRRCVEMILPEETVGFRHIGKGQFSVETTNGEPITHPGGSHKAVISLGIMLTLSQIFDLPVILDEATDRFDYITLPNTFKFVHMLAKSAMNLQICFVSYKTLNIEKSEEIIDLIKDWNIYLLERKGKLRKEIIQIADVNEILS